MASLSVSTIQPAFFLSSVSERTDRQTPRLAERADWPLTAPRRALTDNEAWEKFDSEFRPEQRSPSPIKRQIQTAKYGLDTAVFAIDRFVKNIENHAGFEFDQGRPHHTHTDSLGGSGNGPRVKLDLNMWQGSQPRVGVRVVIPFGK